MTEDQLELLLKSRDNISAAKLLVNGGYPEYATVRAARYNNGFEITLHEDIMELPLTWKKPGVGKVEY